MSPGGQNATRFVVVVTSVAAIGGFLFGYDTAVISGAIGYLRTKFELTDAMTGFAASAAIWGCVFGVLGAGFLSDLFGRKRALLGTAILFAISAVGSAVPETLTQFVGFRFIGGLGVGAASMVAPAYISEIAPAAKRGMLVTLYQLAIVVGINVIYFVNLLIAGLGTEAWNVEWGWRYMLGSETLPALLFFVALLWVPESPRWLVKNGRESEAEQILERAIGPDDTPSVLAEIRETLAQEEGTLRELFAPGLRMAMIVGIVLAIFSQITGINAIIYYAPEIFKAAGFGTESALGQTVILGLTNTVFTFVAIALIDRVGRKTLLLAGVSGMALCLAATGILFYLGQSSTPWLLVFVVGFLASFAASLGPIPWVIISEIFPTKTRGIAMSFSIVMLWLAVVLITQMTPVLLEGSIFGLGSLADNERFQLAGAFTFWIFMVNAILLVAFVWRYVPETKQKTLEEIERSWRH
ncbi:MAG: sugar porter family MFS transporter [Candidatus Latescibacterota bacterium]|jgi:SP family arabinose:H+ symporter-like MFS transporter